MHNIFYIEYFTKNVFVSMWGEADEQYWGRWWWTGGDPNHRHQGYDEQDSVSGREPL